MFRLPEDEPADWDAAAMLYALTHNQEIREGLKDLGPVLGKAATYAARPELTVVPEIEEVPEIRIEAVQEPTMPQDAVIIPFPGAVA